MSMPRLPKDFASWGIRSPFCPTVTFGKLSTRYQPGKKAGKAWRNALFGQVINKCA